MSTREYTHKDAHKPFLSAQAFLRPVCSSLCDGGARAAASPNWAQLWDCRGPNSEIVPAQPEGQSQMGQYHPPVHLFREKPPTHEYALVLTSPCSDHSGGEEVMLDVAGQDATEAFEDVGHSDEARETLEQLLVGTLKRLVSSMAKCRP